MHLLVFIKIYEITSTFTVTFVSLLTEQLVTHSTNTRIECRGISQGLMEVWVPSHGRRFEFRV
jgi:hypothetical protein